MVPNNHPSKWMYPGGWVGWKAQFWVVVCLNVRFTKFVQFWSKDSIYFALSIFILFKQVLFQQVEDKKGGETGNSGPFQPTLHFFLEEGTFLLLSPFASGGEEREYLMHASFPSSSSLFSSLPFSKKNSGKWMDEVPSSFLPFCSHTPSMEKINIWGGV